MGPANSQGGMASLINNMILNTPKGYSSQVISTHEDGSSIKKLFAWRKARKELKNKIENKEVDIVHMHATHSFSWWRKMNLMKICVKKSIPVIIHIHSGRFQKFCSTFFGFTGYLVRRSLSRNCTVVVLEDRWKKILEQWIPEDSVVISNFSEKIISRKNILNNEINLLMLSRNSKGKGHNFAIKVLRSLENKGFSAKLVMTGILNSDLMQIKMDKIDARGWISENEKYDLISNSDFLIMPSDFEGSSMSVIESIVNGLPCIVSEPSSETVGIEELVISLDNVEDWSKKIIDLSVPSEYERINQLLKIQAKKYSIENNKLSILKLYGDIL